MLSKLIGFIFFKILKWKIEGPLSPEIPKKVFIVIPHTSNWDFPLGLMVRAIIKQSIKFVGKSSLFKWPYAFIFRMLGGIPVNRKKRQNFVSSVVDLFNANEKLNIVLAPEGTRKKVESLKTGFYHIADQAKVPLIMVKFDYKTKVVSFREPFYTTGNYEADLTIINTYYKGVEGYNPDQSYIPSV